MALALAVFPRVTEDFFKKYFHGGKDEESILLSIEIFFITCTSIFKINNSFTMKDDKISHFENFNHTSHLNDTQINKWLLLSSSLLGISLRCNLSKKNIRKMSYHSNK